MQCRRREDSYVRESENMELHAQDRLHLDHGRYGKPRRETMDPSPRLRRSLSPHRIGGSRCEVGLVHRVDTIERRNEDRHLRTGRNNNIGSSSYSYGQARKMPIYEEAFMHNDHRQLSDLQQIHVLPEPRKFSADSKVVDYKHDGRYMYDDLRIREDRERWSDGRGQRMTNQKLLATEEGNAMGSYNSHLDIGPTSVYKDFFPSSQSLDVRSLDNERLKFRNHVVSDKPQVTNSHEIEESQRFNSRNIGYSASSGLYSRGNESSSSGPLTSKCLESYRDGHYFQISDEFSTRSHADLVDPIEFNSYGKRTLVDSSIDLVGGKRNLTPHRRETNSPRRKHGSYFYSRPERTVNNSNEDPSRVMQKSNQTHDYVDYNNITVSDDHGDFSRPKVSNASMLKLQNVDDSCENYRTGIALDHYKLRKQIVLDCHDIGPATEAINNDNQYAGAGSIHVDVGRRVTQDYERSHINLSQYCQTSYARSDYGSEREVGSYYLKERLHSSSMSKGDGEAYRNAERVQRMTEGIHTYNLREDHMPKRKYFEEDMDRREDHMPKRKYFEEDMDRREEHMPKRKYFEEDMNLLDRRVARSCEYTRSKVVDLYDGGEQWMDDENRRRFISRKAGFDHNKFKKPTTKFKRHNLYASADSHESYLDQALKYKSGPKYMKGNRRHGPSSWIKSQNVDHRNISHRPLKNWKKTEEENDYARVNDDDLSDDLVISTESEPPEDSEEFKQLVHEAFLKCSKKLNMMPSVRKKYKEQGNAGTLYCIVCGRSHSKEFMNTQRLVTHAYMSHKVGLRAQHLGLAKAICVLMGWNSVPQDTVTWVPEVLSREEIMVQKEDLIIWPPVIIVRNVSLSHNSPDKWRVVTIEALESFLRSKNLLKGRVKMNLGYPADQSVMVLKFLPTFSGLTDAERLNKFFSEKRRGREDYELAKCKNSDVKMEGNKVEEEVLYGYLGTAEDLDDVELNVRKLSLIKSKKEILEM